MIELVKEKEKKLIKILKIKKNKKTMIEAVAPIYDVIVE